jgi:hypothetical protein
LTIEAESLELLTLNMEADEQAPLRLKIDITPSALSIEKVEIVKVARNL